MPRRAAWRRGSPRSFAGTVNLPSGANRIPTTMLVKANSAAGAELRRVASAPREQAWDEAEPGAEVVVAGERDVATNQRERT